MIYEQLYGFDSEFGLRVAGVDEAGRGPLAGPVAVALAVLEPSARYEWLNDSKKVTEKRREELYEQITSTALFWTVKLIDNKAIDEMNILAATMFGMKQCIVEAGNRADLFLIDGNRAPVEKENVIPLIKGDAKSASVAAASVIAKVTRDRFMCELAKEYPEYGFEIHKGYPTRAHYEAIDKYGITPYHRMSFLKKLH